jgi:cytochrome oxidase Cu insertion factor (SCO1/SenC/PrrC family)
VRRRLVYVLLAIAIAATVVVGSLFGARHIASETNARTTPLTGPGPYRGSEPPPGIRLPEFAIRDLVSRRVVRTGDLAGRVVLVTFLDTDCSEQCPIIAGQIGRALAVLDDDDRRQTTALALTVNPLIDTRASVVAFLRRHRVLGQLNYLSGRVRELKPIWRDFNIVSAYETGDADTHSADVRVFDPAGEWVATLHAGADLTPANLAHDIRTALQTSAS